MTVKTNDNILELKISKDMELPVPERRVCDNPTTQEGGSSLSRPVDSNKRRVA